MYLKCPYERIDNNIQFEFITHRYTLFINFVRLKNKKEKPTPVWLVVFLLHTPNTRW